MYTLCNVYINGADGGYKININPIFTLIVACFDISIFIHLCFKLRGNKSLIYLNDLSDYLIFAGIAWMRCFMVL